MQTYRRLNDPERYYGMSWRGWLGCALGGGLLYLAVRVSPLGVKPTISLTLLVIAFAGTVLYGLSGQAIGPGRFLMAALRHASSRKRLACLDQPDNRGLVLDSSPPETQEQAPVGLDPELHEVF
jgi:hypothetical protein